jgi:hypothetical protein
MQYLFLLFIALCPHDPAIKTHDRVVEIYRGFAWQMIAKTQVHIQAGIHKSYGISVDTFLAAEPNTGQPRNDSDDFKYGVQGSGIFR